MELLVLLALVFMLIWAAFSISAFLIVTIGLMIVVGILPWWVIVAVIILWGLNLVKADTYQQHCCGPRD